MFYINAPRKLTLSLLAKTGWAPGSGWGTEEELRVWLSTLACVRLEAALRISNVHWQPPICSLELFIWAFIRLEIWKEMNARGCSKATHELRNTCRKGSTLGRQWGSRPTAELREVGPGSVGSNRRSGTGNALSSVLQNKTLSISCNEVSALEGRTSL